MKELSKTYNPKETEDEIYELWEKSGAFAPKIKSDQKPFVITIPPPNVTGSLHMGHALNNTIQDILIRRARMRGVPTLWLPGTDHAGIATQNVVEKKLQKEGKTRQDLGRDKFEKEIWQWVDEYGHIIIDQLKKLGCSGDWSRQRFTMDDDYSEAVYTAFIHYYEEGYIYQGERVINWCPRCQTALSDIELEYTEENGKLYFIKYLLTDYRLPTTENADDYIIVATTRPETLLGDTAVAVNPKDKRYSHLIGERAVLPFLERKIPIISDEAVEPAFGTGAVKVTPAHDPNDFEIWQRHREEMDGPVKVIDEFDRITLKGKQYAGLKTAEARAKIVADLQEQGLMEKIQDYAHQVPHCYRCGKTVEQLTSLQWFVKMDELAKPAIKAVESGEIKFVPARWGKVYLDWMKNLKDWCISRQIWWGHRLPVWQPADSLQQTAYSKNQPQAVSRKPSAIYVGNNPPEGYKQVDDVLDTWFSSALWPFATLGWPEKTKDSEYFYPTTILSTARDIIYLWVARMIFSGYEFMGKKPFETVYIHPTIFNKEGQRMSKSLGTGVDPIELIEKYGADATRFGLTYINTGVQDLRFDEEAIKAGGKFANKIWNISRFVMISLQPTADGSRPEKPLAETDNDQKILDSLGNLIISVNADLDNFRFGQAAHDLYDFVWHDFADIYLEESKKQLADAKLKANTQKILIYVLTASLKLLHPIMPYLTETIWQNLYDNKIIDEEMLIAAKWPKK